MFSLAAVFGLICSSPPASTGGLELRDFFLERTVRLSNSDGSLRGSGVIVGCKDGSYYVLTARHVIEKMQTIHVEWFSKGSNPKPATPKIRSLKLFQDDVADLALITFSYMQPEFFLPGTLAFKKPAPRDEVFPTARPIRIDELDIRTKRMKVFSAGCSAGESPTVEEDYTVDKKLQYDGEKAVAFAWETKKETVPGRSGGGLFDEKGRVVGICIAKQGKMNYYVHSDEIEAFLRKGGFGWIFDPKFINIPKK